MLAVVHLRQVLACLSSHGLQGSSIIQGFLYLEGATEGILLSVRAFLVGLEHVVVIVLEVGFVAAAPVRHERHLVAFEKRVHRLLFLVEHRPVLRLDALPFRGTQRLAREVVHRESRLIQHLVLVLLDHAQEPRTPFLQHALVVWHRFIHQSSRQVRLVLHHRLQISSLIILGPPGILLCRVSYRTVDPPVQPRQRTLIIRVATCSRSRICRSIVNIGTHFSTCTLHRVQLLLHIDRTVDSNVTPTGTHFGEQLRRALHRSSGT